MNNFEISSEAKREFEKMCILLLWAKQQDHEKTAAALINSFGSIRAVSDTNFDLLKKAFKLKTSSMVIIKLFISMSDRILSGDNFTSADKMKAFFRSLLINKPEETIIAAFLDNNMKLKKLERFSGISGTSASIPNKKIAAAALESSASRLVIAHNHPGGSSEPSDRDISSTLNLMKLLSPLDIELYDHIIIGADDDYSMRDIILKNKERAG